MPTRAATARTRSIPLFSGLRRSQVSAIDRLGTCLDVCGGRVLCRNDDRGDEFFLLLDGIAEVHSAEGTVSEVHAGAWFGEAALLTGARRSATVSTLTRATVIVYDRREFVAMLQMAPTVKLRLDQSAARVRAIARSTRRSRNQLIAV